MGGLNSHMSHVHEDPSLKFSQIKDIFEKATKGELTGAEKTDGQNLFISYSVKNAQAKAARNKSNIVSGGLSARELASKFADRGNLTAAFVDSFAAWESVVSTMPVELQIQIFGPDAEVFYNAEIQDPRNPNVIHYDTRNLVVHRDGHLLLDKSSGTASEIDVNDRWEALDNFLEQAKAQADYNVSGKAVAQLTALDDGTVAVEATKRLDALLQSVGLTDDRTVADFLIERIKDIVSERHNFSKAARNEIVKRLIGAKGVTLNTIFKLIPKGSQDREVARDIIRDSKNIFRSAVQPLEEIIHDFSVEVLSAFQSAFLTNQTEEVARLQKEVTTAIQAIQASGNNDAMKILQQQMVKLKSPENIKTAAEGFVFDYNGKTYKFTGNFAPINQILGLFKFGRGSSIPPMKIKEEATESPRKIAVVPGSYKPPHLGHFIGVNYFIEKHNVDKVVVMISPRSRSSTDEQIEVSAEQAKTIWEIFIKDLPQVEVQISTVSSPVQATYDYMESMNPGDTLFLGAGEKDIEDTRFKRAQEWSDKKNLGVTVQRVLTPMNRAQVTGTDLRDAISNGRQEEFFEALPSHLSLGDMQEIWGMVNTKNTNFLNLQELRSIVAENSAMAAGAVGGFAMADDLEETQSSSAGLSDDFYKLDGDDDLYIGLSSSEKAHLKGYLEQRGYPIFSRKQKQKFIDKWRNGKQKSTVAESSKRDCEMIKRKEFLEEERLRSMIRNTLKMNEASDRKEKEKVLQEENKLRTFIRTLIKEAAADAIPHESTGINVLEDLLKKVVPIIERDYKSLTTEDNQRKSYRSHIIKAVQNLLAPANLNYDSISDDTPMMEALNDEVDIDVHQDEKFIDIDGNGVPDSEEQEEDTFSIPGEDETGRNVAMQSFDKIEKTIEASYAVLSNDQDKTLFYDYLITNLKLYFDKFEDELSTSVTEPNSELYNSEQGGNDSEFSDQDPQQNTSSEFSDQDPQQQDEEELDLRV